MKAITYRAFGAARDVLHIEDVDLPDLGPGEVRIDIRLSGINPSDVKARAGSRPGVTKPPFPVIVPHSDGAGVITAVGSGVSTDRIGERVWIWNGQWRRAFGTAAEAIVLPAEQAVPLPASISDETAAVLGIPGLTACFTVFSRGSVSGQTILVQGGAGTVGFLAVQLARWGGARVIATARQRDHERIKEAGAHAVVDYRAPDAADKILEANDGKLIDRIVEVEFGQNAETDTAVIAENGHICTYGSAKIMTPELPFYPLMFKAVTLEMALIYILTPEQRRSTIANLTRALEEGALSVPIAAVFDATDCANAHETVESGARDGAVLVRPPT